MKRKTMKKEYFYAFVKGVEIEFSSRPDSDLLIKKANLLCPNWNIVVEFDKDQKPHPVLYKIINLTEKIKVWNLIKIKNHTQTCIK